MLTLHKRLWKWVNNIIIGWYFANLNITSIDNLPIEVKASEYVFRSLVRSRLLSLRNGSVVVTIEVHWVYNARDYAKLSDEILDSNSLFCHIGCCNKLSLCYRISNCLL